MHWKASYTVWLLSSGGFCGLGSHLRLQGSLSPPCPVKMPLGSSFFFKLVNGIRLVIFFFKLVRKCGGNKRIQEKLFYVIVLQCKCFLIKRLAFNFVILFLEIKHIKYECIAFMKELVGIVS